MASSLSTMSVKTPVSYTQSPDYRAFIESMLQLLLNDEETRQVVVTPDQGFLYRGNLTAFLLDNQVPLEDHFVVKRMNGITHPQEFNETFEYLLIPSTTQLTRYKQLYRTKLG